MMIPAVQSVMRNEKAFTLIEVLIAMLVLAVGILAVTNMELVSMRTNTRSAAMTEATSLARTTMDRLLNLEFDAAELVDVNNNGADGLGDATAATADFHQVAGRYDVFWNVAENQPVNNCKTIQVNVTWVFAGETKRTDFFSVKNR